MQDFARTAASLVQLVLLLTPLTSLVIGVLALAPERGTAEILFSQPVSRRSILFGRLLGLFAALAIRAVVYCDVAALLGQPQGDALPDPLVAARHQGVLPAQPHTSQASGISAGSAVRRRTRAV
jgi:Cu-processing system permease protein